MERPHFPMFIDLTGRKILVAGGGKIALRRVHTLLRFGAEVHVTAPVFCEEMKILEQKNMIKAKHRDYRTDDVEGMDIVLAATDDREVNRRIWSDCRSAGVMVNTADDRSLCDFYFPSVVMTEDTVIGISGSGSNHTKVKEMRVQIEKACGAEKDSIYE